MIDALNHTVDVAVSFGADLTSLIPVITLSENATSNPVSGEVIDFSDQVSYTVIAADGITSQDWVVTVTLEGELTLRVEDRPVFSFFPNPVKNLLRVSTC